MELPHETFHFGFLVLNKFQNGSFQIIDLRAREERRLILGLTMRLLRPWPVFRCTPCPLPQGIYRVRQITGTYENNLQLEIKFLVTLEINPFLI